MPENDNASLESQGFTLPESEQYLRETYPDYAKMSPQDRQQYLNEMHYGTSSSNKQSKTEAVKEDAAAMVPHSFKDYAIQAGANLVAPGLAPSIMGIAANYQGDKGRKEAGHGLAYRTLAPIAAGATGVNLPAMEREAEVGNSEGVLGHTILPAAIAAGGEAAHQVAPHVPTPTDLIIKYPSVTKGATTIGGGLLGSAIGGSEHGFGTVGGAYGGYRIGGDIVRSAEERAINQALEGNRPLESLPSRLVPKYTREYDSRAQAYARRAGESGEPIESMKIPTGLRQGVERAYEERMKMQPKEQRIVLTPEEYQELEGRQAVQGIQAERLLPAARARGMAHAAGEHEGEWVPSTRGVKNTTVKNYKLIPKP